MKPMSKWMLVLLLSVGVVACSPAGSKQSAQTDYQAVRAKFLAQNAYSFHVTTKLISGERSTGNLINAIGQVQDGNIFVNVKSALGNQDQQDHLSLLSQHNQLYTTHSDGRWRPVRNEEFSLHQEFNNWNPIASIRQMDKMRKKIVPVDVPVKNSEKKAIRVVLDSNKLKSWLAEEMKTQSDQRHTSSYTPRIKMAWTLSNRDWRNQGQSSESQGPQLQENRPPLNVDDFVNNMKLNAEYMIYYNRVTSLPTRILMNISSEYDLDGQRIKEHSQVDTFLTNYGRRYQFPQVT